MIQEDDKQILGQSALTDYHTAAVMLSSSFGSCSSSSSPHAMVNPFGCLYLDVLLTVLIIGLSCFVPTCHASCNLLDRDSLLSFSNKISITPPSSPLDWSSSRDCCTSWEGVVCDVTGRVTSLKLPSRGLSGIISPSLASLTHLSELGLSHNSLTGTLPDGFFTSLAQLQTIDLRYNRLSGQLPPLGIFPATIREVDFSSNDFNGTIQPAFLQQATNLVSFNISNNSFFGFIPFFVCSISPSITALDFSYNHFKESIPQDVGNCSNLQTLRAGFNSLSGPLPQEIYRLTSLQEISFPSNKLNGSLSSDIVSLNNLTILALYANELTGTIPPEIGMLFNLE